jgi:hypothetical protein
MVRAVASCVSIVCCKRSAASLPNSRGLIRIVVKGGSTMSTKGMSLCPTIDMSRGQRIPRSRIAS